MLSVLAGASRERETDAIPGRWKALSVPSSAPRRSPRSEKLRINPRKSWYNNVEEVGTNGDFEVTFRLKRPQPALLALLASGWAPIRKSSNTVSSGS
jgi:ABC-type transport system substrate-binding protein